MLSDYNCRIFESDRYNSIFNKYNSPEAEIAHIIDDIKILGSCGFHRLVSLIDHRPTDSVSQALHSIDLTRKKISSHIRGDLARISFYPSVFLSEELPYTKNIKSLALPRTNYIFIKSPIPEMPSYYPSAINKLLYSLDLIPVFCNFQICNILYPPHEIEKLLRISRAAFQFDISSIYLPENIITIKNILKNGNTVLLGTGFTHSKLNRSIISKSLEKLKKSLSSEEYMTLVVRSHKFPM